MVTFGIYVHLLPESRGKKWNTAMYINKNGSQPHDIKQHMPTAEEYMQYNPACTSFKRRKIIKHSVVQECVNMLYV